jgi:hypothetical protein
MLADVARRENLKAAATITWRERVTQRAQSGVHGDVETTYTAAA